MSASDPSSVYEERAARFGRAAAREAAVSAGFSRARLAVVLVALVSAAIGLWRPSTAPVAFAAAAASAAALVVLMVRHERVEMRRDAAETLTQINREASARLHRRWNDLPAPWTPPGLDDHPYAADLDLFGHASLAQVVGPVRTPAGRATLVRWLLDPDTTAVDDIPVRQAAVRELAPLLDFRQQFTGLSRRISGGDPEVDQFIAWAEQPSWLLPRPWITAIAAVLGLATVSLLIVAAAGWWENALWLVTATAGWVLRWRVHPKLDEAYSGATHEHGLRSFTALLALTASMRFESEALRAAQGALQGRTSTAHVALRHLEQIVAVSDLRLSVWLYLPLQTLTLYELHVWLLIERWRRAHGSDVRHWLTALGHVEALASLASLAHDHPRWTFPRIASGDARIEAQSLGHPLLADTVRVSNDITVGPPGRFLLITGSNMSGKSTLLRATGLNLVLARAGGPVCAAAFTAPPASLHTSMRVADSLEQGLSLFMASLTRLQRVVEAARHATADRPVCYLLDEVLQGTNSAERQIAVRTIIGHLLACHAIGAATTHDLELAADPSFTASADSFHLQETLGHDGDRVTMTFDYRLRPGPASAGNALQLLKMLGLD